MSSPRALFWTGTFALAVFLATAAMWFIPRIQGSPKLQLFEAFIIATGLVVNHWRWWKAKDNGLIGHMMIVNYLMILIAVSFLSHQWGK